MTVYVVSCSDKSDKNSNSTGNYNPQRDHTMGLGSREHSTGTLTSRGRMSNRRHQQSNGMLSSTSSNSSISDINDDYHDVDHRRLNLENGEYPWPGRHRPSTRKTWGKRTARKSDEKQWESRCNFVYRKMYAREKKWIESDRRENMKNGPGEEKFYFYLIQAFPVVDFRRSISGRNPLCGKWCRGSQFTGKNSPGGCWRYFFFVPFNPFPITGGIASSVGNREPEAGNRKWEIKGTRTGVLSFHLVLSDFWSVQK